MRVGKYSVLHMIQDLTTLQRRGNLSDAAVIEIENFGLQNPNMKLIPLIDEQGRQISKVGG
ncbi:hypothetical protein [Alicyclobacillus sp. SO9]|uniref:hypothetical protein n=1 Tax=Alicyclobacillus sp. SO9 TaxID=2665646 RepID=UPI0018E7F267|nr:hypothetical protein [Alicyclobacillus sp. SO9]